MHGVVMAAHECGECGNCFRFVMKLYGRTFANSGGWRRDCQLESRMLYELPVFNILVEEVSLDAKGTKLLLLTSA